MVAQVNTDDWTKENVHACGCSMSSFCDPHHGHVVTGDLRIINNRKLRSLLCKGPKYREPQNVQWDKLMSSFSYNLTECLQKWADKEKVDVSIFSEWEEKVQEHVSENIKILKKKERGRRKCRSILRDPTVKSYLEEMQKDFVFVPTDKACNNISIICKRFYIERTMEELGLFSYANKQKTEAYQLQDVDIDTIVQRHKRYMRTNISMEEIPESMPFLYWIPKMHKKPVSKQRYIAASNSCTTKPLSAILSKCLKLVEKQHALIGKQYHTKNGINPFWIISNSTDVHKNMAAFNRKRECKHVRTYDFDNMYTSIPHKLLKRQLAKIIRMAFSSRKKSFISVYKNSASWTNSPKDNTMAMSCDKVIRLMNWLVDNIYVTFGDKVFRQVKGIPMGTDCAPFLANLFCYSYEYEWIDKQVKQKNFHVLSSFKACCRYIDDLLTINNYDIMDEVKEDIYPKELTLTPDKSDTLTAPYLDLLLTIKNGVVSTSIFDKRDAFDFPIVNFPTLTGNIPLKCSYGVFVGELVRYARACTYLEDFNKRSLMLVGKLLKQSFRLRMLKRTWFRFCDSHFLLIQKYGPAILDVHQAWCL